MVILRIRALPKYQGSNGKYVSNSVAERSAVGDSDRGAFGHTISAQCHINFGRYPTTMNRPLKFLMTVVSLSFATTSFAQIVSLSQLGESVDLDARAPDVDVAQAISRPGHESILHELEIVPSYGSSPPSYLISGKVVSDNTGFGVERVALFVGADGKAPLLAGMTDSDGEFKFRLWIKEDNRSPSLSVSPAFDGYLYVGGYPSLTYRNRLRLMAGYTIRYKLTDLAKQLDVRIVANPEWQNYSSERKDGGG